MNFKLFFLFFVLTVLVDQISASAITSNDMLLFAVTPEGKGTTATLNIHLMQGTGDVWSKIGSFVGISTQNTEKTVVALAKSYSQEVNNFDYKFDIVSPAQIVDGPSAGLPMGLLLISMIQGKNLPDYISATGTISTTGTIGKVGGVLEKTKEAASKGIKLFLIPKSELEVVVKDGEVKKVNLSEYAYSQWDIKVVGVDTLDDALTYAFSDLDDIDVNVAKAIEKVIYNPPAVSYPESLSKLYDFTSNYRNETKANIENATDALNTTTLNDNDILNYLYEVLTTSQTSYDDGNIALDKNYLYSAANYLFISNIYANLVYDIASDPEMINSSSKLVDLSKTLKAEIEQYKLEIKDLPYNNTEWNIAAKERLLWAEKYLEDISTVSVVINGTESDSKVINLGKAEKYEFSKEWIRISRTFNSYIQDKRKVIDDEPYKKSADEIISELDKAQDIITTYNIQDLDRRIYGAKTAYQRGWYLVSIYESASALAIINSTIELEGKDYFEVKKIVAEQSNELEKKISNKQYVWTTLYYAHSKYFYNAAEFYEKQNKVIDALDNIKNAHQLLLIAKNISETISDLELNKETITKINTNTADSDSNMSANISITTKNINSEVFKKILAVLLLALLLATIIIIILYKKYKHSSVYDTAIGFTNYQIYKTKEMIIDLDKKFLNAKLDETTYKALNEKYRTELKELENKKDKLLEIMTDIESVESEMRYLQNKLDTTNSLFKKGLIGDKEYKSRTTIYKKELSNLTTEVKEDENKMISAIGRKTNANQNPKIKTNSTPFKYTKKKLNKKQVSDKKM